MQQEVEKRCNGLPEKTGYPPGIRIVNPIQATMPDQSTTAASQRAGVMTASILQVGLGIGLIIAASYWFLDMAAGRYFGHLGADSPLPGNDIEALRRLLIAALLLATVVVATFVVSRLRNAWPFTDLRPEYEAIVNTAFDLLLVLTAEGRIKRVNHSAAVAFGTSRNSLQGLSISNLFLQLQVGDDPPETDIRILLDGGPVSAGKPIRATAVGVKGRTFPVEIRIATVTEHGETRHMLLLQEQTALVAAEEAAKANALKFDSLFDNMLDGVYQTSAEGRILAANPALVRLLGYSSKEELCGTANSSQFYRFPHDRHEFMELLATQGVVRNRQIELVRKDGAPVTVLANSRAVIDETSGDTNYEGTFTDISSLVAAQQALTDSEEHFRAICEHSLDAVTVVDEIGTVLYANPASASIMGLDPAQAVGRNAFIAIHADDIDKVRDVLDEGFNNPGSAHQFTFRYQHSDGSVRHLESVGSAYRTRNRQLRGVIHSRDITARLNTEAQLQHSQKLQAVGQLTGGIAHDFNNLLTVIVGNLQLLEEQIDDSELDAYLQTALRASFQGAALTRRLLAFSRRQYLEPKVLNVNQLLTGMDPIFRRSLAQPVQLHTRYADDLWLTKVDPAQLESALLNLAINARDSMSNDGRLTITTGNCTLPANGRTFTPHLADGDYICITVADTGCGMPEDVVSRAIEPFFSTKENGHGTGLGLSMVYGFVQQSGGNIHIESRPGAGSTVQIYLPRTEETEAEQVHTSADADIPPGDETILVVDDNQDVRDSVSALVTRFGYRVVSALNGKHALHIIKNERIDLLFSDIMMPGISGIDLALQAKLHDPNIRILFTTGYTSDATFSASDELEQFHVIRKPYTKRDLALQLRELLDNPA